MKNKNSTLPMVAGLGSSFIFGLSFLFSKKALAHSEPLELISFRFLTALIVMSALLLFKVIKVDYKGKDLKGLLLLGFMEPVVYFIFETYGIKYSSSSQAGLMISLIPIFVVILSAYFLKEKPSRLQLVFIFLSVAGVMYIGIMGSSGSGGGSLLGMALLLGAVLSAAAFTIISRKLSGKFTPIELTYSMMVEGAVIFTLMSLINHLGNGTLSLFFKPLQNKDFIISVVYLGILSSIVAYFLINYTLSKIEASKSAVISNMATIVSIIAGVLILKENFAYYHIIGSIMILAGVWGTNYLDVKKISK
ncbi:DMT family transporter [Clostridium omnivorum]|uniref:Permease n=1 Tax=Clostridium omnivorum TaxID=1604902 RepID=A0ABQ5N988_9CLOT|nr:DMT family transporter [Clostridium sp. E14]GLC31659.1 permease [Clostridium sp. E14]